MVIIPHDVTSHPCLVISILPCLIYLVLSHLGLSVLGRKEDGHRTVLCPSILLHTHLTLCAVELPPPYLTHYCLMSECDFC